jgi:hypothetical protein
MGAISVLNRSPANYMHLDDQRQAEATNKTVQINTVYVPPPSAS